MIKPTAAFVSFKDVTVDFLKENKIDAILLDVDNTVSPPSSKQIYEGVQDWLSEVKKSGVEVVKPLPFGFIRAKKKLSVNPKNALVVGDQIFTDILGAKFAGMKSVLLVPQSPDNGASIKIRRRMELPIRKKLYGKNYLSEYHK